MRALRGQSKESAGGVTLNAEISDEVLKKTVEDQDYKVLGIE